MHVIRSDPMNMNFGTYFTVLHILKQNIHDDKFIKTGHDYFQDWQIVLEAHSFGRKKYVYTDWYNSFVKHMFALHYT